MNKEFEVAEQFLRLNTLLREEIELLRGERDLLKLELLVAQIQLSKHKPAGKNQVASLFSDVINNY